MNTLSFVLYCFMVTFTPGPTNIVILTTTQNYGVKKALSYTYGSTVAFFILLMLSGVFNSALVNVMPDIILFMKIVGTVYMLYLCYQILKSTGSGDEKNYGNFSSGFIMQFLNPKVVLFTLTVIPSFVLTQHSSFNLVFLNIMLITVIGFIAFISWLLFGTLLKRFIDKHKKAFNITMSLALFGVTIMIWL